MVALTPALSRSASVNKLRNLLRQRDFTYYKDIPRGLQQVSKALGKITLRVLHQCNYIFVRVFNPRLQLVLLI